MLDAVDTALERTRTAIDQARRLKRGLVQKVLAFGIDENRRIRNPEVASDSFKDSLLGRIPLTWEVLPLAKVAEVNRGKFTPRPRNDPRYYGGPHPFIQTGDITKAKGRVLNSFTQTLNDFGAVVSRCFPLGTIAVTIAANIADTAILGIPMFFPDSIVGVVVKKPHNTRFIELCIRKAKGKLEAMAPQSAQKNINLDDLRPLQIPVPKPDEQERIGLAYEVVDNLVKAKEIYLEKLERVKRGLMQDLLTGKVRVKQVNPQVAVWEQLALPFETA